MQPVENKLSTSKLQSDPIIEHIKEHIRTHPDKAKAFNAVILFIITKDGQTAKKWTLDLKSAELYEGEPRVVKPSTIVTVSDEDFVQLMLTNLNPQQAFMEGKIIITGNNVWMHKVWILIRTAAAAKL